MESSLVKIDNIMAWDGLKAPFVEEYVLFLHDPKGAWSFSVRFSFVIEASQKKVGSVEAFFQDEGENKIHLKKDYNLDEFDVVHADQFLQIGKSGLSLSDCMGFLQNEKHAIKWECFFEDPVLSYRPYPDSFYPFSYPQYKMMYPRFLNFARGVLYVDHKKFELQGVRVCQYHGYGKSEPKQSLFAQCLEFEEDSDAVFSVYAPRFGFGKTGWPFMPFAMLSMEGELFTSYCLFPWQRKHWQVGESFWHFAFSKNPFVFEVNLEFDLDKSFEISEHAILNNRSHLSIEIFKKTKQGLQDYKTLTSQNKTSFLRKGIAHRE